ncbi:PdaC/SigV domain-containing protein [Bizionia sediminis]|uniref:PdaC/SigV domain-containing protein n=1 Tax=Bizionia sediminis TaxID=1737064 RepID=A0ABW5KSN1_9FLAO
MPKHVLYLLVICLVFSCAEESTITFSEQTITSPTNQIVEVNIPVAYGHELIAAKINSAIDSVIIANLSFNTENSAYPETLSESIEAFNAAANRFKTDFPESPMAWEAQIDGEIMYQSNTVISVAITSYLNTGGAHGNLVISFLNFDAFTGKRLRNQQLFNDYAAFKQLAKKSFSKHIANKEDLYFDPDNFVLPENIGFNDTGVILLYNSYEIAPYTTGLTEFTIDYETIYELLNYY